MNGLHHLWRALYPPARPSDPAGAAEWESARAWRQPLARRFRPLLYLLCLVATLWGVLYSYHRAGVRSRDQFDLPDLWAPADLPLEPLSQGEQKKLQDYLRRYPFHAALRWDDDLIHVSAVYGDAALFKPLLKVAWLQDRLGRPSFALTGLQGLAGVDFPDVRSAEAWWASHADFARTDWQREACSAAGMTLDLPLDTAEFAALSNHLRVVSTGINPNHYYMLGLRGQLAAGSRSALDLNVGLLLHSLERPQVLSFCRTLAASTRREDRLTAIWWLNREEASAIPDWLAILRLDPDPEVAAEARACWIRNRIRYRVELGTDLPGLKPIPRSPWLLRAAGPDRIWIGRRAETRQLALDLHDLALGRAIATCQPVPLGPDLVWSVVADDVTIGFHHGVAFGISPDQPAPLWKWRCTESRHVHTADGQTDIRIRRRGDGWMLLDGEFLYPLDPHTGLTGPPILQAEAGHVEHGTRFWRLDGGVLLKLDPEDDHFSTTGITGNWTRLLEVDPPFAIFATEDPAKQTWTVTVWDLERNAEVWVAPTHGQPKVLATADSIVLGSGRSGLLVWDKTSREKAWAIAATPDMGIRIRKDFVLYSLPGRGTAALDPSTGEILFTLPIGTTKRCMQVGDLWLFQLNGNRAFVLPRDAMNHDHTQKDLAE